MASSRLLLLLALCATALATTVPASAGRSPNDVHVVVVPASSVERVGRGGAVGLVVPGAGATVSRERALRSLVRGRVVSSLVADEGGTPLIRLATRPGPTTIYVSLPPPGPHHNDVRYPVAIVGSGYRGILVSPSTRLPGLVSLADIAPTAVALARGERPPIRSDAGRGPAAVATLDARLTHAHDARGAATIGLGVAVGIAVGLALLLGSARVARIGLLIGPVAIVCALALSAAHVWSPLVTALVAGGGSVALAVLTGWRERLLAPAVGALLAILGIVLVARPEVAALAAIGPHPDGGARFYGVTNQVETLLLAPVLAAAATSRRAFVAIGALALAVVGWSRAGADGGGVVVLLVGLGALAVLGGPRPVRWQRLVVGAGVALALLAGLVLLEAVAGASSHVSTAVGSGPSGLLDDAGRRLEISWAGATRAPHTVLLCAAALGGLVALAAWRPRRAVVDAGLLALAASLVVNDSPVDVLVWGALGSTLLRVWADAPPVRVRSGARSSRPARRAPMPHRS